MLFGFVWGFVAHMSLSESKIKMAYQQGYDARDAQAYRNLQTISHLVVTRRISDVRYDMEPRDGGTVYKVKLCDPLKLEEGWEILTAVTEKRDDCLSFHLDKAELTIDRSYHEIASR